jgi:hypothetical protein
VTAKDCGGEGILRLDSETGTVTIWIGGCDDGGQGHAQGFHDGVVELRFLDGQLVVEVVFFFGSEIGGGYLLYK